MAIQTVTFHKRSTGMTGQVLASPQIERKLARVEALYEKVYGTKMGRYNFYKMVLPHARDGKADVGGYLQYMAQDVAGIFLDHMHKALSAYSRRNSKHPIIIACGTVEAYNLRDLARSKAGRPKKEVA
tara:strand:+ start:297 stop:680 length:384 start_codon:yes stop_codon:yes gene_type:complete